jgi:Ca2+-binding RTX toxin-like protein
MSVRSRNNRWLVVTSLILAGAFAGCAVVDESTTALEADPYPGLERRLDPLTPLAADCDYNSTTGVVAYELADGETAVISRRAVDGVILANGFACDAAATSATVKRIDITGSTGANVVIIDYMNGSFALGTSAGAGIVVDLLGGTDEFSMRGKTTADTVYVGADGIAVNTDSRVDITVAGAESYVFSLGEGNDIFGGQGGFGTGLASTAGVVVYGGAGVDTLTGTDDDDEIYGGDGNDVIAGDAGDDELYGGEGDDTFDEGGASNGGDVFNGEAGRDTVSYALRTAAVTVTMGAGSTNDGEASEADDVLADIEVVTGGTVGDTLTGSANADTINGGGGDDTIDGGDGDDTLNGGDGDDTITGGDGDDLMHGDAGDDTFDEEDADSGSDVMFGDAGEDTVDYSARTAAVTIVQDTVDNDGLSGEGDTVRTDIEVLLGGSANDNFTGGTANNTFDGGAGDDTLSGGGGDDTFLQGSADDGSDIISGGTGIDLVDYSERTDDLTVTMDGLAANDGLSGEADNIAADVEMLLAGEGDDTITGNALNNLLEGGDGMDTLNGDAGADELFGGAGDDNLNGGAGDDTLDGGDDDDTYDCGAGDGDIAFDDGGDTVNANCEL